MAWSSDFAFQLEFSSGQSDAFSFDARSAGRSVFVADGKGGRVFAKTLQENNANVEKWFAIRRERGEM